MEKNIKDFWSNCSFLMRLLSLTIILALITPVLTNAQSGKANFAGTWALNAEKSTQPQGGGGGGGGGGRGGFGGGLGSNFVATMDASSLTVVTTRTGQDGTTSTRTTKYILDGKENVLTTTGGAGGGGGGGSDNPPKYVAKWSADGKSLTIATTRTFNETTMTSTALWSLSDAKTLSVLNTSPGRDGGAERKTTMVYDKK